MTLKEGYKMVRRVRDQDLLDGIRIAGGRIEEAPIALYSIVHNEAYFLPAFLDHYRRLGVKQFIFVDDNSTDETEEILRSNSDCVVLKSEFGYGEYVLRRGRFGLRYHKVRAGILLKRLIPQQFFANRWAMYADPDEFLILPSIFPNLESLVGQLDRHSVRMVMASMVEFYPSRFSVLQRETSVPANLSELLKKSPYFDSHQLIQLNRSRKPTRLNPSASGRLFDSYGVSNVTRQQGVPRLEIGSATQKVPLIKASRRTYLRDSHNGSRIPPVDILLCVAHFKFTSDLLRRFKVAMERGTWSHGSKKYGKYEKLIEAMKAVDGSFLEGCLSRRYQSPADLEVSGNLWARRKFANNR